MALTRTSGMTEGGQRRAGGGAALVMTQIAPLDTPRTVRLQPLRGPARLTVPQASGGAVPPWSCCAPPNTEYGRVFHATRVRQKCGQAEHSKRRARLGSHF